MIRTIHKWFWVWDFDKEEKWLNEMAAKGLALYSVGFCRYDFEDCTPGEYKVCLEFLKSASRAEEDKYIEFLEETGIKHVGRFARWAYFRKKTSEEFRLFSSIGSQVEYLTRIIRFIALICLLNLYFAGYNLFLWFTWHNGMNLLGIANLTIALLGGFGIFRLIRKRKRLRQEQQIFE